MTKKVFNMEGGLHSAMAYSAFENKLYGGSVKASPNDFIVSAGSGMNAVISPGDGLIDTGSRFARRIQTDANETVAVAAASASFARIDSVVAYIDTAVTPTTSVVDNINDVLKFASVAGTAASTPVAPTGAAILSAIGAGKPYMILYDITVPQNATNLSGATFTNRAVTAAQGMAQAATASDIINGSMAVAQRVLAPNISSTYQYGAVDRMAAKATGTAVSAGTIAQTTTPNAGSIGTALKLAGVTVTGTGKVFVRYRMEAKDAARYKNSVASFSAKVYQDTGGAKDYIIRVGKAGSADNFASVTNVATSPNISVPTGTPTTISLENINSGNLGDVSNGLEIEIEVQCGAVTTKNFEFAEFSLARTPIAVPFRARSFVDELQACMRYYEKCVNYETAPMASIGFVNGAGYSATDAVKIIPLAGGTPNRTWGSEPFRVPKRAAPTMRYSDGAGNVSRNSVANANVGAIYINQAETYRGIYGYKAGFTFQADANPNLWLMLTWDADAEL